MSEITDRLLAALATAPEGLTTREVYDRTGMTSYTVSNKLSQLGACGVIGREKIDGQRYRWSLKPLQQPQRITPFAKPGELLKRFT